MVTVKYDLKNFKCIYLGIDISVTDRGAYAYKCSRTKSVKYVKKESVNNYVAVNINGVYCMVFTDDFNVDEDRIHNVNVSEYIGNRRRYLNHINEIHQEQVMEIERKIEYFKSKLK
ncbi:hypothetical protein [Polaribacter sp.]|uniref:hypothetical protein n=1 Tax=Polaribacter sp. TaxID=1920175 RepID=UPI003F6CDE98